MLMDTCNASIVTDVKGAQESFRALSLKDFPGENVTNNLLSLNPLPTKSDNQNFRPTFFTELECTVSPFLLSCENTENVKVCMAAMIFGQGLWFVEKMEKSLINPNQCRDFGVQVCHDPTDPNRKLGYYPEVEFMPMTMVGSTATIMTSYPTDLQMDTCEHIVVISEEFQEFIDVSSNNLAKMQSQTQLLLPHCDQES